MSTGRYYQTHYTFDDYCQWSSDWELWYGTAVAMTPSPLGPHERFIIELVASFVNQIKAQGCHCKVYAGLDWVVTKDTVVRPDLMVVCGEQPAGHLTRAPGLAVEVLSESTARRDRQDKFELYQSHGVKYYFLVDTDSKTVEGFTLEAGRYVPSESLIHRLVLDETCELQFEPDGLFD